MSQPPTGNYYIVNNIGDVYGRDLAVTYQGQNTTLNVAALKSLSAQEWYIADYSPDSTLQTISPVNDTSLQVCFGGSDSLTTLPAGGYVWNITRASTETTIQDGGGTVFWGLRQAASAEPVWVANDTSIAYRNWLLIASR
ncbi:hypothetical protein OG21DRAFT_1417233 [Imleria badia]|nr:hypothetical protein OG21DRAFT_1417233 [Imleria badia]